MKALLTAVLTVAILVSSYVMLHAYEESHHTHHEHSFTQVTVDKFIEELNEMPPAVDVPGEVLSGKDRDLFTGIDNDLIEEVRNAGMERRGLEVPVWARTPK